MFAPKPSRRHLVGVASLTSSLAIAALSFASLPAGAQTMPAAAATVSCPVLSLANPSPGDNLVAGGLLVSGIAYDPAATSGTGVARIDLFLGQRDSGGTPLGTAVTGGNPSDPRAFSVEVQVPTTTNRGEDFSAYAVGTNGQETAVSFPVYVGVPEKNNGATPTPVGTQETVTSTCPKAPAAVSGSAAPAMAASPAPATSTGMSSPSMSSPSMSMTPSATTTGSMTTGAATTTNAAACPVLSLSNPGPANNLIAGGEVISGIAYDPAATSGSGVARVDLFLGDRDAGGTPLGSAVPGNVAGAGPDAFSVEVQVPGINRGVDFAAYAIGDNGQETKVTFPVFVGVPDKVFAATPTPIPTTETVTTTCGSAH